MNLYRLKWTKNVRSSDGEWAYSEVKVSDLFKLAWKDNATDASKLDKDDLVLLRQKGFVTHLVKILDHKPRCQTGTGDYDLSTGQKA